MFWCYYLLYIPPCSCSPTTSCSSPPQAAEGAQASVLADLAHRMDQVC